jgi:ABC-2 type transport system ATP-binding protein
VPAVSVRNLRKSYGSVQAVRDVSFTVAKGEVFALLGPNGAGKTTTIEILEGFRTRDHGTVEVLGVDPGSRGTQRWLRSRMGIVLQELAVEPFLSVRQVLTRNASYYPNPRPVGEVLDLVGLASKAQARVKTLSGGQQRRLDVGLGIIGRPELMFLDEPTTGLDPSGRRATWEVIESLGAAGTTVILTSHYMDEVEALANRVAVLAGGEVVASGTPDSIGGRDSGVVTIRFRLPDGVPAADLPVDGQPAGDGEVEIRTEDELPVLHALTGWALDRHVPLPGLTVRRVTLEDVYLTLTGGEPGDGEPASGDRAGGEQAGRERAGAGQERAR